MKIEQTQDPEIALVLKPFLIDGTGKRVEGDKLNKCVEYISNLLQVMPENVCVLIAHEDGEVVKAFIIAMAMPEDEHVFLFQAWRDPQTKPSLADTMLFHLLLWCQKIGRDQIRAESSRSSEAFYRRWNFEEHSKILKFNIPEDLVERMVVGSKRAFLGDKEEGKENEQEEKELNIKENPDGRQERSKTDVEPKSAAERTFRSFTPESEEGGIETWRELRGGDDSSVNSGDGLFRELPGESFSKSQQIRERNSEFVDPNIIRGED
jgi:hypothetical protein